LFQSIVPCRWLNVCVRYLTGQFRASGFAQLYELVHSHLQTDIEWSDKQHRLERFAGIYRDWETLLLDLRNQFEFVQVSFRKMTQDGKQVILAFGSPPKKSTDRLSNPRSRDALDAREVEHDDRSRLYRGQDVTEFRIMLTA